MSTRTVTSRRRKQPWIQRRSRPLIGAIAIVGAILTGYLTVLRWTGATVACSAEAAASSGCGGVLSSSYATVFGQPLSLFGCLAYIGMAAFALGPLAVSRDRNRSLRAKLEDWSWLLLLAGATAMTVFSGYLMYVLTTDLKSACPYCIGSATFALSMLVLTLVGREWEDFGQVAFTGLVVALVTVVGTLGVYADNDTAVADSGDRATIELPTTGPTPGVGWKITSKSGPSEMALAQHLKEVGATKYGAYWCPHCHEQKQLFGEEAFAIVPYVECAKPGGNGQTQECRAAGIQSYPTWEIDGQLYRGTQTLDELADATGYEGPRDFKYKLPSGR